MDVSLAGWSLKSSLSECGFDFPDEQMLSAKSGITIWWGEQHKDGVPKGQLWWDQR